MPIRQLPEDVEATVINDLREASYIELTVQYETPNRLGGKRVVTTRGFLNTATGTEELIALLLAHKPLTFCAVTSVAPGS